MHCVDLGERFPTSLYLQNLASTQPRKSPVKFARSPRTDRLGLDRRDAGTIVSDAVSGRFFPTSDA